MKKYLLIALLLLAMTLVACGSEEAKDTDVKNPVEDKTEVEVRDNSDEPEVPVDDKDSEVDTEESVEPNEPVVDMVDFETWAKQEGNEDVCLVVWNEEKGIQKILEPVPEEEFDLQKCSYTVQEGDRFAVSRRSNILYIVVNLKTKLFWESEEQQYMELEILPGEKTKISIACEDSDQAISYLFNY